MRPRRFAWLGWVVGALLAAVFVALWKYERAPHAPPPPREPEHRAEPARDPASNAEPSQATPSPENTAAKLPIRGHVVMPHGKPFPAARVAVRSGANVAERLFETKADGAFETIALAPGRYTLLAWVRNDAQQEAERGLFAATLEEDVEAGSEDVTITLAAAARTKGRVEDAQGQPIARAHVLAKGPGTLSYATAITDANGAFELILPSERGCTLEVRLPSALDPATKPITVEGVRGGAPDVVVRAP